MIPTAMLLLSLSPSFTAANTEREWELPEGLEATLFAESPQLYNPTAMDIDAEGRVWVTEAVNYRKWGGRNPGREHAEGDRIVVLEDTTGDGRCDHSWVFAQDEDLVAPLGIAVIGDEVYVSCSPHLLVYRDTDGDGQADEREVLLTGFGGFNHDHGLHSVVGGPDGRLYLAVGNAGPHLVTDRSGWRLRSGSLYRGGGPKTADNRPGLVSDDGRAWTGGLVLAFEPDGTGLEVLAHNFRNNYEVAVDAFGNCYQTDNDDDGNRSCRTLWCLPGGNHGFTSADGTRKWQADRRPGQETQRAHWHQDDPGVVPAGSIHGAGGPTGIASYDSGLLGEDLRGCLLSCDAGAGVVLAHRPQTDGAGIGLETHVWMRAGEQDQRTWFRPSDVAIGPDGAAYVADWFDPGVGGHAARDREAYGRILRIAPEGYRGTSATKKPSSGLEGWLADLRSPLPSVRYLAARALAAEGPARETHHRALRELWRRSSDLSLRARALWILAGPLTCEETRSEAAQSSEPSLRGTLLRVLKQSGALEGAELLRWCQDPDSGVRREAALALRDLGEEALDAWLLLADRYEAGDRYALEALGLAAEGKEELLFSELMARRGEVALRWSEATAELAWRLHPQAAVAAHAIRAMEARLPVAARRQAMDALAFVDERPAAEAMWQLSKVGPEDLRSYATWWLRHRATHSWRDYDLVEENQGGELADADQLFRSEVVRGGEIRIDVDVSGYEHLWLVVEDGGDGNGCDWADWLAPTLTVEGDERALTDVAWLDAQSGWGTVGLNRNCRGQALRVGDREEPLGIGTHAPSTVAYALPTGATRLVTRAGIDRGGSDQGCGNSVRFVVYGQRADDAGVDRFGELQAILADASREATSRKDAAAELAADPRGALRVLQLASKGELDEELKPAVSAAIFRNPDIGVRALARQHFEQPGLPASTSVESILAMEGDIRRGQQLFLDSERSQCMTCHTYQLGDAPRGGDIGPELTLIREKYGKAQLLDSILNPSAGIALGYEAWMIEMTDGEVFHGFLLAEGENVVLKDTRGERFVLPADEIAQRTRQTLSTMPEGLATGLEPQELADLVAFLSHDFDAAPVFGEPIELFDGRSLQGWTHHLRDGSVSRDRVWTIRDGILECAGRPAGYVRTEEAYESYRLTLEWRFDPEKGPGNSGVLLRQVGEDKVWPRSMEAQLQHRNAGDIWNIDRFPMATEASRTRGRHTARAQPSSEKPLGEWNRYEILVHGPRLELRVNDVLQNTADWCEVVPGKICLQSEGAWISFRNIQLEPIE